MFASLHGMSHAQWSGFITLTMPIQMIKDCDNKVLGTNTLIGFLPENFSKHSCIERI